ncbi:lycopene beta-cyclase CrtY [Caulobacter endophyticus]|uniref:lycopene beta-cyclase CrtY n=1 Tax=Caulobacter endophyticus TaxID=2172652 RepID=UPI00240F448E|nr:lycopene beta-cyclase CrtY [Caulobacter endophyticus]MDG2528667.1 lycopene beta-cyclase CrtY [Caulobacter endophyticus]
MESASAALRADVVLVGGGLANSLIALRLKALRPGLRVLLLEREATIGGEHTWCHFETDVDAAIGGWLRPLIVHRWTGYEVRFPAHSRRLPTPYLAITSKRLHEVVTRALGPDAWTSINVVDVNPHQVTLADGRRIVAGAVIDGRGARRSKRLALGWQKFVGQDLRLAAPHGLSAPIIMDATVPQTDGYRFVYVLPLDAHRLLIEDTRYSDGPGLDRVSLGAAIADYARGQGWTIEAVEREEHGVLPIALGGDIDAYWREARPQVAEVGLRAALFQPTTGYSLPDAARLADKIAALPRITSASVRACVEAHSKAAWRKRSFLRLLNRMLFRACAPEERYRVLERFYRLSVPLIQRFYAARLTWRDKARVLIGKPPVPIPAAMKCISESSVFGGQDA